MLATVPLTHNASLLQQVQNLVNSAKVRDIKKQKALIEIRKALASRDFYWA